MSIRTAAAGALAVAGVSALLVGSAALPAQAAATDAKSARATCFGGAQTFTKAANLNRLPRGSGSFTTGPNCADINMRSTQIEVVKVCFDRTGCQSGFKILTQPNVWQAIATGVRDNTTYHIDITDSPGSTVQIAD